MRFTERERAWAGSVFAGIYPRGSDPRLPLGAGEVDVEAGLARMEREWPATMLWTLRLALWVAVFAPLWVLRRPRLLPSLGRAEQARVLGRLYESEVYALRSLVVLLKAMGGMIFAGSARVRAAIAPGVPAEGHALVQLRRHAAAAG